MSRLVKSALFSLIEIKFNLLKDMLDEAGIAYLTNNENSRAVKPALSMMQSNIAIDILVYEEDLEEVELLLESIK